MLLLQNISFGYRNHPLLFSQIQLFVDKQEKLAVVGNNGAGKSTLLSIAAGRLSPLTGSVIREGSFYYLPQLLADTNSSTVSNLLGIAEKRQALIHILNGNTEEVHFTKLADDWSIEERSRKALEYWGLNELDFDQPVNTLSGGQRTKVLLAGILIHEPDLLLLDEPSNHLDRSAREQLYQFILNSHASIVVISHDRQLLKLMGKTCELSKRELKTYGGNYDFYLEQKNNELHALRESLRETEKSIRRSKAIERETIERQQKLDARGKKKQEKAGVAKIMMNTLRNQAEQSTAKLKNTHIEKKNQLLTERKELQAALPEMDKIRLDFEQTDLHVGKKLIGLNNVNVDFGNGPIWKLPLDFHLFSGSRWAIQGMNGSGKTTLLNILQNKVRPTEGSVERSGHQAVYLDQHYQLLDPTLTVYEQVQHSNERGMLEHELKNKLNRFLFDQNDWQKRCRDLSGGERMRLALCLLSLARQAPDLIILDEPGNNLDLQNIDILTSAIASYEGTLVVVSHDQDFLRDIGIEEELCL